MSIKKLPAFAGMDNVSEDTALERGGDSAAVFFRDALNVDFTASGQLQLRQGVARVTSVQYQCLWQSPLHKDCFALHENSWVKVNPETWQHEVLAHKISDGGEVFHQVVNNRVVMACDAGLYAYDGKSARKMTVDTPARPYAYTSGANGSISQGKYHFAVSWLLGRTESALSETCVLDARDSAEIELQLPYCTDVNASAVRLYMTEPNGSELQLAGEYPIGQHVISIISVPDLGRVAQFQHLSPMCTGRHLRLWRGRLICCRMNVIHFSEPMAFHLTDERYNFVLMPQRITFLEPVDGGIWVGQVDHAVFLRGTDLKELSAEIKATAPPVAGTSTVLSAEEAKNFTQGGEAGVIWLAQNGYVLGTGGGQCIELQSKRIQGITGQQGQSVGFEGKILSLVQ